jgi:hypothetical protein
MHSKTAPVFNGVASKHPDRLADLFYINNFTLKNFH